MIVITLQVSDSDHMQSIWQIKRPHEDPLACRASRAQYTEILEHPSCGVDDDYDDAVLNSSAVYGRLDQNSTLENPDTRASGHANSLGSFLLRLRQRHLASSASPNRNLSLR
jgi:hypothetical protein